MQIPEKAISDYMGKLVWENFKLTQTVQELQGELHSLKSLLTAAGVSRIHQLPKPNNHANKERNHPDGLEQH
jgi:hypothetical protein